MRLEYSTTVTQPKIMPSLRSVFLLLTLVALVQNIFAQTEREAGFCRDQRTQCESKAKENRTTAILDPCQKCYLFCKPLEKKSTGEELTNSDYCLDTCVSHDCIRHETKNGVRVTDEFRCLVYKRKCEQDASLRSQRKDLVKKSCGTCAKACNFPFFRPDRNYCQEQCSRRNFSCALKSGEINHKPKNPSKNQILPPKPRNIPAINRPSHTPHNVTPKPIPINSNHTESNMSNNYSVSPSPTPSPNKTNRPDINKPSNSSGNRPRTEAELCRHHRYQCETDAKAQNATAMSESCQNCYLSCKPLAKASQNEMLPIIKNCLDKCVRHDCIGHETVKRRRVTDEFQCHVYRRWCVGDDRFNSHRNDRVKKSCGTCAEVCNYPFSRNHRAYCEDRCTIRSFSCAPRLGEITRKPSNPPKIPPQASNQKDEDTTIASTPSNTTDSRTTTPTPKQNDTDTAPPIPNGKDIWNWMGPVLGAGATIIGAIITVACVRDYQHINLQEP